MTIKMEETIRINEPMRVRGFEDGQMDSSQRVGG